MTSPTAPSEAVQHPARTVRRPLRGARVLAGISVLVALWFGLSAPTVSPVPGDESWAGKQTPAVVQYDASGFDPDLELGDRGARGRR